MKLAFDYSPMCLNGIQLRFLFMFKASRVWLGSLGLVLRSDGEGQYQRVGIFSVCDRRLSAREIEIAEAQGPMQSM